MYKGATLKADLMRILRERDHPEEASRPLEKWRNKEIVEALVQSDIARAGEAAAGLNPVYQQMLETEHDVEAAEDMKGVSHRIGAHLLAPLIPTKLPRYLKRYCISVPTECIYGEDAAAAVELEVDSLFGSSSSSDEDESSDNEEDDEERADDATALGFMKSHGVDVYTPEEGVDELARTTFEAGLGGIAGIAASAASGVLPATSYVYGYPNAVGAYSEMASGGSAGVDLWVPVFRIMLEQAKYEFESQESMRAKKTGAANKAVKAALRQAKQRQARRDLPSTWTAGMPRTRNLVLKAQSPVVGPTHIFGPLTCFTRNTITSRSRSQNLNAFASLRSPWYCP